MATSRACRPCAPRLAATAGCCRAEINLPVRLPSFRSRQRDAAAGAMRISPFDALRIDQHVMRASCRVSAAAAAGSVVVSTVRQRKSVQPPRRRRARHPPGFPTGSRRYAGAREGMPPLATRRRCRLGERALDETGTRLRRRHPPQRLSQGLEVVLGHVKSYFVLPFHTRSAAIIRSAASSSRSLARARCRRDFRVPRGISIIWASSGRL